MKIQPTQEQDAWLTATYKMYNRYTLAVMLKISERELTSWMRHFDLKKRDTKAFDFTDEQKRFIKDNYMNHTHEQMAIKLGVSVMSIQGYCYRNGYKKYHLYKVTAPPKKRVITVDRKPSFTRPPATYSNTSREQHVEKWINIEVPAQRNRIGFNQQKKTA